MSDVAEHAQRRTLHEVVITPDHAQRTESAEFRASKARLTADGHHTCWVCGTGDNIQIHHYGLEWSLQSVADFTALKEYCETFDVYGYGRLLKNQPITTADDVRNMMALCAEHHIGVDHADGGSGTGIHEITFPAWLAQKLCEGSVIPQAGESEVQAEADVKAKEADP